MADLREAIRKTEKQSSALKDRILSDNAIKTPTPVDVSTLAPTVRTTLNLKTYGGKVTESKRELAKTALNRTYIPSRQDVSFSKTAEYRNYLELTKPELFRPAENAQEALEKIKLDAWGKTKAFTGSLFQKAIKGFTYAAGSLYAGATEVANPFVSLATTIAGRKMYGDSGESFGESYISNLKTGNEQAKNYLKGIGSVEQLANAVSPKTKNSLIGSIALSTIDTFLDPTTYISFGTGKGMKLLNAAGKEVTLTKEGTKLFRDELASKLGKLADLTDGVAVREVQRDLTASWENLNKIAKYADKGGIQAFGETIAGTEKLNQYVNKAKVASIMHRMPGFDAAADMIGGLFKTNIQKKVDDPAIAEILEFTKRKVNSAKESVDDLVDDLTRGLTKEEYHTIMFDNGNVSSMRPYAQEQANKIYQKMGEQSAADHAAKILYKDELRYAPRHYNDTPDEIIHKLKSTFKKINGILADGGELTPVQKSLLELKKSVGDVNALRSQPSFTFDRFFQNIDQINEVGLNIETDLNKALKMRLKASIDAIEKKKLMGELETYYKKELLKNTPPEKMYETIPAGTPNENYQLSKKTKDILISDAEKQMAPGFKLSEDDKKMILENYRKSHLPLSKEDVIRNVKTENGEEFNVVLSKETNKMVENALGVFEKGDFLKVPDWAKKPLQIYDGATQLWKRSVLAYPATALRNLEDSTLRNIQDIGLWSVLKPGGLINAAILSKMDNADDIIKFGKRMVNVGGVDYSLEELNSIMKKAGVFQDRATEGLAKRSKLMKGALEMNKNSERFVRAQNFLANLDKTGSIVDAAKATLKTHYDYTNLSAFEKGVLSRIFPFYSFRRKNMAFQIEELMRRPGPYMALERLRSSAYRATGGVPEGEPDYIRNGYAIPIGVDKDGNRKYLGGLGLSFEDVDKIFSGFSSKRGFEKEIIGSTNPYTKMAYEQITKRNVFMGKNYDEYGASDAKYQLASLKAMNWVTKMFTPNLTNLQEYTTTNADGETVKKSSANPFMISAATALPTSRTGSIVSNFMREDKTMADAIGSAVYPAKVYTVDKDYAQTEQYFAKVAQKTKDIEKYMQMNLIKESSNGIKYVDKNWSSSQGEVKTAELKAKAKEALRSIK